MEHIQTSKCLNKYFFGTITPIQREPAMYQCVQCNITTVYLRHILNQALFWVRYHELARMQEIPYESVVAYILEN